MRRGDTYWIKQPALTIDGNLARRDVCSNNEFRRFIWNTVAAEQKRVEAMAVDMVEAWTEVDGINTLYLLPNGHRVLFNDDVDRGTRSLYYEDVNDCHAEKFKEWYTSRKAKGKPVLVPLKKIMEGTGRQKETMADFIREP